MKLPRATPSEVGLDAKALKDLIAELGKLDCHSVMVQRHGKVCTEGWWAPYAPEHSHMLFSVSKSFTSTAIGFAVGEGLLSVKDRVMKFFADDLPCKTCEHMQQMTVHDLLTMSTGHVDAINTRPYAYKVVDKPERDDCLYHCLTSYVDRKPGSLFVYNNGATYMANAILQKLTGQKVVDYLQTRLFEPLGIKDVVWETNSYGKCLGYSGLLLGTEDLAKFGEFLLRRGMWNGKQLLSSKWFDEATKGQVTLPPSWTSNQPSTSGYGYQFWVYKDDNAYRADGLFGQFDIVMPVLDAVVTITSGHDQGLEIAAIVPKMMKAAVLNSPKNQTREEEDLQCTACSLKFPPPKGEASPSARARSGDVYEVAENELGIQKMKWDFAATDSLTIWKKDTPLVIQIGHGSWVKSVHDPDPTDSRTDLFRNVAAAGAWRDGKYHFEVVHLQTPYRDVLEVRFDSHGFKADWKTLPSAEWERSEYHLMGRPMHA